MDGTVRLCRQTPDVLVLYRVHRVYVLLVVAEAGGSFRRELHFPRVGLVDPYRLYLEPLFFARRTVDSEAMVDSLNLVDWTLAAESCCGDVPVYIGVLFRRQSNRFSFSLTTVSWSGCSGSKVPLEPRSKEYPSCRSLP